MFDTLFLSFLYCHDIARANWQVWETPLINLSDYYHHWCLLFSSSPVIFLPLWNLLAMHVKIYLLTSQHISVMEEIALPMCLLSIISQAMATYITVHKNKDRGFQCHCSSPDYQRAKKEYLEKACKESWFHLDWLSFIQPPCEYLLSSNCIYTTLSPHTQNEVSNTFLSRSWLSFIWL